jgi:hypothetical protein
VSGRKVNGSRLKRRPNVMVMYDKYDKWDNWSFTFRPVPVNSTDPRIWLPQGRVGVRHAPSLDTCRSKPLLDLARNSGARFFLLVLELFRPVLTVKCTNRQP